MLSYDKMVLQEHILQAKCFPPYLEQYQGSPPCKTQEELKNALYSFNEVRKKYIPTACERISRIWYYGEEGQAEVNSTWAFAMIYPEYVRVITQSKEVDIHSLIGNIGGYIGLFLGIVILLAFSGVSI